MYSVLLYGYWYGPYQRPHHLARWLKKMNINVTVLTKHIPFWLSRPKFQHLELNCEVKCIKSLPVPGRLMLPFSDLVVAVQERKFLSRLTSDIPVIVYTVPFTIPNNARPLVFDCLDDFSGFGSEGNEKIGRLQKKLAERSHVIWTTSHWLFDIWHSSFPEKTSLIPNGADVEHFSSAVDPLLVHTRMLPRGKRAIVGYVGAIARWFDGELLKRVAESLPNMEFILVGPVSSKEHISMPDNVMLLGPQPYEELPKIISQWDCCIIPFVLNDLTKATNPIKMYEYLAAGKPVVSTALPEIRRYEDLGIIETADNWADFADAVSRAVSTSWDVELVKKRTAIAANNSWDKRFEKAYKTLMPFLPKDWPTISSP